MDNKGQITQNKSLTKNAESADFEQIVLEKGIFSSVFEKDIRRVYLYKKSERIAKAIHMISPALKDSKALRDRVQRISVEIIDASVLPPAETREILARELLALSSILKMARAAGLLSSMNADIIMREAHSLLQEVAQYDTPRIALDETPTLANLARSVPSEKSETKPVHTLPRALSVTPRAPVSRTDPIKKDKNNRRDAVLSILRSKGPSSIKDLSTLIREVSEKTIQRELQSLISLGQVERTGERRWSTYTIKDTAAQ